MVKNLIIFGAKSTALEIYEVCITMGKWTNVFRVHGDSENVQGNDVFSREKIGEILSSKPESFGYILSMANYAYREDWMNFAARYNISPTTVISPHAYVASSAKIGQGVYIAPEAVVSSNATIGDHTLINYSVTVGHDSRLGKHCLLHPGAKISGNVIVGDKTLIGANAFIFQGKKIGLNCSIDALTYVDRDLDDNMIASSRNIKIYPKPGTANLAS